MDGERGLDRPHKWLLAGGTHRNALKDSGHYPTGMDAEFSTALLSLLAATAIVTASFFQWWDVRANGEIRTKRWAKVLFAVVLALLYVALVVLIFFD